MAKITDYQPMKHNPNKGTQRGMGILDQSVRELGAGRSLLVDKNGVIIAGNHAQEAFVNAGIENVIEVETDGTQIVVVKRTDMEAESAEGKKMAIMDNRASELGLSWDEVVVEQMLDDIKAQDGEIDRWLEDLAYQMNPEIDYDEEWRGMPEFEQEDSDKEFHHITVHFETIKDLNDFAELTGQSINEKTTFIWYPRKENMNLKSFRCDDES